MSPQWIKKKKKNNFLKGELRFDVDKSLKRKKKENIGAQNQDMQNLFKENYKRL